MKDTEAVERLRLATSCRYEKRCHTEVSDLPQERFVITG